MTFIAHFHSLALLASERMLNGLIAGGLLALFGWIALRLMGRQNSRTRFAIWFITLLAIAALPLLGRWEFAGRLAARAGTSSAIHLPEAWALYFFCTWGLIAAFRLARVAHGLLQIRRTCRSCPVLDPGTLDPQVRAVLQEFPAGRRVRLRLSETAAVPAAVGFFPPSVVIPAWCLHELSADELRAVLVHELEHLRRWDDWTNLLQRILSALLFFHPAVWWIDRRLSLEREMACDDAVLARASTPKAYARCLISVAEKSYMRRGLAMALAAVSRVQQMSARIAQILDADRPTATPLWKPALWVVGGLSIASAASLTLAPEFVAFRDVSPRSAVVAQVSGPVSAPMKQNLSQQRQVLPPFIPAAFTLDRPVRRRVPLKVAAASRPATKPVAPDPTVIAAAYAPDPVRSTLVEPASPPLQVVFVMMDGRQDDASGPMVWSVRVVRLTFVYPQARQVAPQAVPSKI